MTEGACPIVLAAPSGTGKTTLARKLVESSERYVFSVSATTRPPRARELDGIDYHFVSRHRFDDMVDAGELAEWAEVHGHRYGTPRSAFEDPAAQGQHVVLDIDVQGARQIRVAVPEAKLVFVLPPSVQVLMGRLRGRGTEDRAAVARRLRSALEELQAVDEFDYVVVNDELERCLAEVRRIAEGRFEAAGHRPAPEDVEALRSQIVRILDEEYAEYVNVH